MFLGIIFCFIQFLIYSVSEIKVKFSAIVIVAGCVAIGRAGAQQWSIRDIKAHQHSHKLLISLAAARGPQTIRQVGLNSPL